ncbi:hypothetical protein [Cloacibacillus evryensis]|uniref:Uncharacterized protein n=1 Tax=Cloacibacillus evryensis TaxID=508460 RepID=A0AAW5JXV9_9BACT|nr:hypothetical protein [Cloacibacillus evryensis]MCQ4763843.1 hypothetical protein [Cloacibacillus evryensis]MCQ4813380.1 hypothetical protein [Cloacibacillus evryensis]MEA5034571.1 hypothetical protein [Cloacibacillus evryensis]
MNTKFLHYLVLVIFAVSMLYAWLHGWRPGIIAWLVLSVSGLASLIAAAIIFLDNRK